MANEIAELIEPGMPSALTEHTEFGRKLARQSVSASTLAGYTLDLQTFGAWCEAKGVELPLDAPVPVGIVHAYLSAQYAEGRAPATLRRHVAAIAWWHRKRRFDDPTKDEAIGELLRGITEDDYQRKVKAGAPSQKRAAGLRQRDVDRMSDKAEERAVAGSLQAVRDLAVLQLARSRLMRASELVSLTVGAISQDVDKVNVTFRRIKTRGDEKTFELGPDAAAAVAAWLADLARAGITDGPLFRALARHGRIKATGIYRQEVTRIIKRMAGTVKDLAGKSFSAHSLRRGKAQDMRQDGATVAQIQNAGGWHTQRMVNVYTDSEDTSDDAALAYDRKHARHK